MFDSCRTLVRQHPDVAMVDMCNWLLQKIAN